MSPHTIVKNMRNKFVFLCKFANLRKNIRRFSICSFRGPKFGLYYSRKKYWYLLADTLVTNWCEKFPKNDRYNRRRICVTFWPIFGGKIIKCVQFFSKKYPIYYCIFNNKNHSFFHQYNMDVIFIYFSIKNTLLYTPHFLVFGFFSQNVQYNGVF